jgi:hypothetical protein
MPIIALRDMDVAGNKKESWLAIPWEVQTLAEQIVGMGAGKTRERGVMLLDYHSYGLRTVEKACNLLINWTKPKKLWNAKC